MSSSLAIAIQRKLDAHSMTVSALERKANLKATAVRNILYGRSVNPGSDTLSAIAKAFGCTIDELIHGHSENKGGEETSNPQATLRQSKYNWELAYDCLQLVEAIIRDSQKEPTAEMFWSLVEETYYYSVHGDTATADKKYAEWLVFKKIP